MRGDAPDTRLDKLEALLAPTSPDAEIVVLFADLLSIPPTGRQAQLNLTPQRKRERTLEVLAWQLAAISQQKPGWSLRGVSGSDQAVLQRRMITKNPAEAGP